MWLWKTITITSNKSLKTVHVWIKFWKHCLQITFISYKWFSIFCSRLRVITTSSWWRCTRQEIFLLCRCNILTSWPVESLTSCCHWFSLSGRQEHLDQDRVNVERHGDPVRQHQGGEDRCKRWIQRSSGGRIKRTRCFISCNNSRLFQRTALLCAGSLEASVSTRCVQFSDVHSSIHHAGHGKDQKQEIGASMRLQKGLCSVGIRKKNNLWKRNWRNWLKIQVQFASFSLKIFCNRNKLFVDTILIKNGTISMKVGTIAVR